MNADEHHRTRTLWLGGVLHAFTHIYHVALMPLYLLIQQDLKLASVGQATFLMTMMMAAYFVPSYPMGILADRFSRTKLLGTGLAINGLGFIGLAFAPNYAWALTCVMVAGFGGSFFHPAATALVARLYPARTGKALGWVGVGASVGFFLGPIYTGWRAAASGWRAPILELGLLGLLMAGIFTWLAREETAAPISTPSTRPQEKMFPNATLWTFFLAAGFAFSLRDFTGTGMGSLTSLFLQKAHGFSSRDTGLALSGIFIASAISNPLFGGLSDRGRMRWACLVLMVSALMVAIFPRVPPQWLIPTLAVYGFFFMSNYPMVEAALMEAVPDSVRGRVFGLFITIGGLTGNLSHRFVGDWVDRFGDGAGLAANYYRLYGGLSMLVLLSLAGLPCLHAIRKRENEAGLVNLPTANVANKVESGVARP